MTKTKAKKVAKVWVLLQDNHGNVEVAVSSTEVRALEQAAEWIAVDLSDFGAEHEDAEEIRGLVSSGRLREAFDTFRAFVNEHLDGEGDLILVEEEILWDESQPAGALSHLKAQALVDLAQGVAKDERHWSVVDAADRAESAADLALAVLDFFDTPEDACPETCAECKAHEESLGDDGVDG